MTALERLRADLTEARRKRAVVEASMIRTLIAAIENAEAVESAPSVEPKRGLGHDVPRKVLTERDISVIIEREHSEVAEALAHYRDLGLTNQVEEMERRLTVVERYRT
ncbi:MAG: hypothetical protein WCE80_12880 [Acidimicrobiia bacterium]